MRVWTYLRPFEYSGLDCVVEVTLTLKETISRLFINNELVDEQSMAYSAGAKTFVHPLPSQSGETACVKSGYYNSWNIAIAVIENEFGEVPIDQELKHFVLVVPRCVVQM